MDSIDGDVGGADISFDDELMIGGSSASGAGGVNEDSMIGMLTKLNIVDITEVFSSPRVVASLRNPNWIEGWIEHGLPHGVEFRDEGRQRHGNEADRDGQAHACHRITPMQLLLHAVGIEQLQHEAR